MSVHFTGPFAPMCEQFVAGKRLLGIDYTQQEKLLRAFDNFSKAYPVDAFIISEELASAWSKKRPNESEVNRYNRVMEIVLVGKCVGPTSDNYQIMGIDCFYAVPKAVL